MIGIFYAEGIGGCMDLFCEGGVLVYLILRFVQMIGSLKSSSCGDSA